jgi:hypothetical protein
VREAVANESKLALLDVLLDGVQEFLFRDLYSISVSPMCFSMFDVLCDFSLTMVSYLELRIGPSRDLNDHVQNSLLLVGEQWDIMEG